ncbi:phosphopantetheine-binding protein [Actinomadura chokoriensis]|uniref:Phosphopantetheine-binding protein n=1 Tax=Actinomadura chokoriensis TaxID=454156 RepID=A0ABV4QWT6_9ACTN
MASEPQRREWDETFEAILREHVRGLSADDELDVDLDLRASGLDSIQTIHFLVAFAEAYGVEFSGDVLSLELFSTRTTLTPARLWQAMAHLAAGEPPPQDRAASDTKS